MDPKANTYNIGSNWWYSNITKGDNQSRRVANQGKFPRFSLFDVLKSYMSTHGHVVKLDTMRRTVLINYDPETETVDIRHYSVKVVPTGVSRAMKKLMKTKLPDLGHHKDIADMFLDKGLSDSEGEQDGPHNQVTVEQKIRGRGVTTNAVNAIRLKEIGPRLNLSLVKIEEGFEGGNVMFHALVQKTPEELEALKKMRESKRKEKLARKQRQEANVKKKQQEKDTQKQKSLEGMKRAKDKENQGKTQEANNEEEEDDDVDYFRQEVGEEPEPEMFSQGNKRKRKSQPEGVTKTKRFRPDKTGIKEKSKKGSQDPQPNKKSKFTFKMNGKSSGTPMRKKTGAAAQKKSFKAPKPSNQRKAKRK
ncbi:suppressor of SWI4 1 homolog [Elysia marginata]|uniref:Suppressor of SWI4 1 homolog n=1 Tax=Elysia marginata TaxID=1093978 RepID=A0AAV4H741_9GAST|nr:suppressor of SWI4 1 homolog [Elysia marginata]